MNRTYTTNKKQERRDEETGNRGSSGAYKGMVVISGGDSGKAGEGRKGRWVAGPGTAAPSWRQVVLDDGVGQGPPGTELRARAVQPSTVTRLRVVVVALVLVAFEVAEEKDGIHLRTAVTWVTTEESGAAYGHNIVQLKLGWRRRDLLGVREVTLVRFYMGRRFREID